MRPEDILETAEEKLSGLKQRREELDREYGSLKDTVIAALMRLGTSHHDCPNGMRVSITERLTYDEAKLRVKLTAEAWKRVTIEVRKLDKGRLDRAVEEGRVSKEVVAGAQKFTWVLNHGPAPLSTMAGAPGS